MCILIVKPQGVMAPTNEILKRCFDANPDGAGVCYEKNGSIIIKKGLMDFKSFTREVEKIPVESTALLHCRIGTSGGNIPELTHPYPLTNNIKDLKRTSIKLYPHKTPDGKLGRVYAVGHNGVFSGLGEKGEVNDTCMFIANILTPLLQKCGDILDKKLDAVINRLVDNSRIAIMDNTGRVCMYGSGWTEQDGIYYSNTGYKPYKYTYTTYYDYDDYDDGWYDRGYKWQTDKDDKDKKHYNYGAFYDEAVEQFGSWYNYTQYLKQPDLDRIVTLMEMYPECADWIEEAFNEKYYTTEELRRMLYDGYGAPELYPEPDDDGEVITNDKQIKLDDLDTKEEK